MPRMPREPGPEMVKAMRLVLAKVTPYMAAKRAGIALSTMYRSRLYKLYINGEARELRIEMKRLDAKHAKTRENKAQRLLTKATMVHCGNNALKH